jgi:prephenate dehydratase
MKNNITKIGIQGGKGSFNEEAIQYYLKKNKIAKFKLIYLHTSENVLKALSVGTIDRGNFAIHNSLGGVVHESVIAMGKYNFTLVNEYAIKIAHALMIRKDATLSDIDTIMTHPQVLAQCRKNLAEKYPKLKKTSGEGDLIDHALVARNLGEKILPKNVATMGSKVLAKLYGLKVVEDNLQDATKNYTSFLLVSRENDE